MWNDWSFCMCWHAWASALALWTACQMWDSCENTLKTMGSVSLSLYLLTMAKFRDSYYLFFGTKTSYFHWKFNKKNNQFNHSPLWIWYKWTFHSNRTYRKASSANNVWWCRMLSILDGSASKRPSPKPDNGYPNGGVGGALKLLLKPGDMCMAGGKFECSSIWKYRGSNAYSTSYRGEKLHFHLKQIQTMRP